jgi:hypothetical protein
VHFADDVTHITGSGSKDPANDDESGKMKEAAAQQEARRRRTTMRPCLRKTFGDSKNREMTWKRIFYMVMSANNREEVVCTVLYNSLHGRQSRQTIMEEELRGTTQDVIARTKPRVKSGQSWRGLEI